MGGISSEALRRVLALDNCDNTIAALGLLFGVFVKWIAVFISLMPWK
jgi:hypothetical protein